MCRACQRHARDQDETPDRGVWQSRDSDDFRATMHRQRPFLPSDKVKWYAEYCIHTQHFSMQGEYDANHLEYR